MKNIITLLLFGITAACSPSDKPTYDRVFGKYEINGFNSRVTIELRPEGEFIFERILSDCLGGDEIQRIFGYYVIDNYTLKLTPKQLTNTIYLGLDSNNSKKDSLEYYSSDSTYLKKEFQVFTWDSLIYLLSEDTHSYWGYQENENDYERFSNYYNCGYEPKQSGSYFVKRVDRHLPKTELDIANLPLKYQARFLKEPIVSEILSIDKLELQGDSGKIQLVNRYKLNRGRQDGVMEKMEFYGNDGCCIIRITDVNEKTSFGRIYLCFDNQAECGQGGRVTTYLDRER
jgi:hypothetical protein